MKKNYKLLVFDFDGTLYDNYGYLVKEYNKIAADKKTKTITDPSIIRDHDIYHARRLLNIPYMKIPGILTRLRKALMATHKEMLIVDLKNIVKELSQRYDLSILSTNKSDIIMRVLEEHDLTKYFKSINVAPFYFGKTRALKRLIKDNGLKHDEVLYIGDEIRDVISCKKIDVDIMGVSWGFNSKNALIRAGADSIADSPSDLLAIMK